MAAGILGGAAEDDAEVVAQFCFIALRRYRAVPLYRSQGCSTFTLLRYIEAQASVQRTDANLGYRLK